ncbi:hypothetical protein LVD17_25090 [Fulvivirga ulvae]|uniref:hypothetical protein n=1 Tax=Fulvivirga ulvae TaxID=2904245 RepID=UPI001F2652F9|nr:hypothetical protein [Fulvivirga ulvae]UII31575.1 hypothetical protein LVD17_25090 [Fulvivirga ulvae]
MKTLKLIVLALLLPMFAMAQNKDQIEKRIEKTASKQTNWMKSNLKLNGDQLEDVREINLKYVEKREEVFMEKESKENKWEELEENWNEQMSELQDVLDENQYAKLARVKTEWYNEMKTRWQNDDRQERDDGGID